jgi:hypothetical protein
VRTDGQLPAGDVSAGDAGRAYLFMRALSNDHDDASVDQDDYAQVLMDSPGDRDELLRGLGTITDTFMSLFRPAGDHAGDHGRC